ncbi:tRNA (adenosine(37)-N6)-threonylcarbamoyltransferase complex ATPase subunit type 1 TsaE [Spirochaetia bacterium]|nr:tRNA (adenosine(37)-N6)-threonylcarbamoyltransferase complex ATPase subunit type 1 TsaE [Spirochaetia bacterium]
MTIDPLTVHTASPEETIALGERIAPLLPPGSVIALRGGLGAGKTCFAKGIARGLGIREEVTSPTYTIISEYAGRLPLYHIDAYRLEGDDDFSALGGEEFLYGRGITLIEWSERLPRSIPANAITIELELLSDGGRMIHISDTVLLQEILKQ